MKPKNPRIIIPIENQAPFSSPECDCACTEVFKPLNFAEALHCIDDQVLEHPQSLFQQSLNDSVTLVWNAESSPYPILLDKDAQSFFNEFRNPRRIKDFQEKYASAQSYKVASELLAAHILQTDTQGEVENVYTSDTLIAWIHITNACNLGCDYCYIKKSREHMNDEIARLSVDTVIHSAKQHGYSRVKLKYAGGEATLRFSQVIELHQYAEKQCKYYGLELEGVILSNGTLVDTTMISKLKDANIRLMISLDGLEEVHDQHRRYRNGKGSFQQIARSIEMLLSHDLIPHISITVTSQNIYGLPELIRWLLKQKISFGINFYRNHDEEIGFSDLQLEEKKLIQGLKCAFKEIEKNLPEYSLMNCLADRASLGSPHLTPCAAGHDYLVINQNGLISKCQMEIEKSLTSIFASDPLTELRNHDDGLQNLSVAEKEGCKSCTWRFRCAGGCPVETFRITGRYDIKSPNCNIYKAIFPEILRLEGLRLLKHGVWI